MPTEGRPNYFDSFEPHRVEQGEAVSRVELIRRLAHYLQIPQRFGYRLMLAYEEVMHDALLNGEGLKIKGAGTITLERHKKDTYKGFGQELPRKILYKHKLTPSKEAKRFIAELSAKERNDNISTTKD